MKKILVSDYDQTFYLNDVDIETNKKWVSKFRSSGNIFAIATGRSYQDLKRKQKQYNFTYDYAILNHGATIIDNAGKIISNTFIPDEIKNALIKDLFLDSSAQYFCTSALDSRVSIERDKLTKVHVRYSTAEEVKAVSDEINRKFKDDIKVYLINNNSLEIISNKTNKAIATHLIMDRENVDKSHVYTVGNGHSDVEMISEFDGYAMKECISLLKKITSKEVESVSELIQMILEDN